MALWKFAFNAVATRDYGDFTRLRPRYSQSVGSDMTDTGRASRAYSPLAEGQNRIRRLVELKM